MKHDIRGAVFDFDGTLADSMYIWNDMGKRYLESLGVAARPGLNGLLQTMSMEQAADYFISEYGVRRSPDEIIDDINSLMERDYAEDVRLKDGACEMLRCFSAAGIKMCIATANVRASVCACLRRSGVLGYFEDVLTCRDVNCGKDCPDLFLRAGDLLGTPAANTYVFEDSLHALITAKGAGFPVVAVYDPSSESKRVALAAEADIFLPSFRVWKKII